MPSAWRRFFIPGFLALVEIGCGAGGGPARYQSYAFAVMSQSNPNDYSRQWFLSSLKIDETTGALTLAGTWPLASSGVVRSLAADPGGRFLCVARSGDPGDISAFAIDGASGELTEVAGSPFVAGESPQSIGFDAAGQFVYVLDNATIVALSLDPQTGSLEEIPGSPFAVGYSTAMAIKPAGGHIYVAGNVPDGERLRPCISAFTINPVTGALAEMTGSPFAVRIAPSSFGRGELTCLAADPAGRFLLGLAYATWNMSSFFIGPQTGALTEAALSPFNLRTYPKEIAVGPFGKWVFVVTDSEVCVFDIDAATGTLREAAGSPYRGGSPGPIAVDPSGKFVYVGRWELAEGSSRNTIVPFSCNAVTGALTELADLSLVTDHEVAALTIIRIAQDRR